ncbi:ABC transporter ATP-binding protein [Dactylosporangium sp. NPDC005555]|uniref:ABC transporter ATP-binding protein n=1 Tax=Dactylosporangium sp. NPDC005555 TaxID=3154889 RepID=UPI0033BADA29
MPDEPVLDVRNLSVSFTRRSLIPGRRRTSLVVDDVDLTVHKGRTLGLVGESGSGKSTTAKAIVRLVDAQAGEVRLNGVDLLSLRGEALKRARRSVQMVFQDPYSSLDPTMTITECIAEPLTVHRIGDRASRVTAVLDLLDQVGLPRSMADLMPSQLSGGQRQRVAIARAICLHPDLVLCDEPVSALDVSTQNRILQMLTDLRASHGISFVLISHNLAAVQQLADDVAVMYCGTIVERGPAQVVTADPKHPYTRALVSAVPYPDPEVQRTRTRVVLTGDPANPADRPPGCVFQGRCPEVMPVCRSVVPRLADDGTGRSIACHLYEPAPAPQSAPQAQPHNGAGPVRKLRPDTAGKGR